MRLSNLYIALTKLEGLEKQARQGACALYTLALTKLVVQRSELCKEHEHRPQGVYIVVHDQGGAERNTVMRSIYVPCGSQRKSVRWNAFVAKRNEKRGHFEVLPQVALYCRGVTL